MLFRRPKPQNDLATRVAQLEADGAHLRDQLMTLIRSEATREAEHAAMLDKLNRVFKRISTRIARENGQVTPPSDSGESVFDMRRRLGR